MHAWSWYRFFGVVTFAFATPVYAQQPATAPAKTQSTPAARVGRPPDYPVRPPAAPEQLAHGQQLFRSNCAFCHGSEARGGETGPNLVLSQLVLDDQHGELITPVVQNGRPAQGMPKFALSAAEISDIAAWLHAQPLSDRGSPSMLDIVVGSAKEGQSYFSGAGRCMQCHSVTGDLAGIGSKYDPKTIQNLIVSGGLGMRVRRGAGDAPPPKVPPTTVTVTLPSGQSITGDLDHISAFIVALKLPDGTYRSFARHGSNPKVVVNNPLEWHTDMLAKWRDADIHNLTAYLVTLK